MSKTGQTRDGSHDGHLALCFLVEADMNMVPEPWALEQFLASKSTFEVRTYQWFAVMSPLSSMVRQLVHGLTPSTEGFQIF